MRLTLIGMSGAGKTTWAGRLARAGYMLYSCDDLIAARLAGRLPGGRSLREVGAWMGLPGAPGYAEREAAYLRAEREVMETIADELRASPAPDAVIDTTGSAVYAPEALARLRELTTVVYLRASEEHVERMRAAYLRQPRPVAWNGRYRPRSGETEDQALARCYRDLLEERIELYERFAHVALERPAGAAGEFLQAVNMMLEG